MPTVKLLYVAHLCHSDSSLPESYGWQHADYEDFVYPHETIEEAVCRHLGDDEHILTNYLGTVDHLPTGAIVVGCFNTSKPSRIYWASDMTDSMLGYHTANHLQALMSLGRDLCARTGYEKEFVEVSIALQEVMLQAMALLLTLLRAD